MLNELFFTIYILPEYFLCEMCQKHLTLWMDLHSKKIISDSFGKKKGDINLVLQTLGDTLKNRKINSKQILHSDLRARYISKTYANLKRERVL